MNAAGDRTEAATKTLTGIPLISNLAPALTMLTAVSDKKISMIDPQNKPVLGVKSSDIRLCGGEAHLRVKKMSAASDRTRAVIGASVEIAIVAVIMAPTLTIWTTVSANINAQSKAVLGVKSSDSRLPARIPGTKWQISARISESPQFSIRDTRAMVDPAALIAARFSGR
jgi:hypothetical protein